MTLNDALHDYIQRGFSLVPFKAIPPAAGQTKWKKKPIIKWEDRQRTRPDEKITIEEFAKNNTIQIGRRCYT